jgi:uncharacterized protein YbjT (DUF2867 family)
MRRRLISVFTGSSNSGRHCIEALTKTFADQQLSIRGVFRTEDKAKPFREEYPNLEIVVGSDARHPETLAQAFRGAQAALIVVPCDMKVGFDQDAFLTETMINHAVANGVEYIVLVTSFSVNDMAKFEFVGRRFQSPELLLKKLGEHSVINWTILLGGVFMENLLPEFKKIKQESVNFAPDEHLPMVDTKDLGECAAVCLASDNQ